MTDPANHPAPRPAAPHNRRVLVLVAVGVLAVMLVLGAFAAGRMVSGDVSTVAAEGPPSDGHQKGYDGPVTEVVVTTFEASCQAEDSVDGAGAAVRYPPWHTFDGDLSTAWRCPGSGVGERLTLGIPGGTHVAEVGLVPGYAKSDPVTGDDRYAENNRITRVRWTFDDGTSFVQRTSGDPADRRMHTIRIPLTVSGSVSLEVLASRPGARDTMAVSEVRLATPAR